MLSYTCKKCYYKFTLFQLPTYIHCRIIGSLESDMFVVYIKSVSSVKIFGCKMEE